MESVDPGCLSGSELVDAIVASERVLSHVQGLQAGLLAAFSRPGAAGDLTDLVAALTEKVGRARGAGGEVDPELLAALVGEQAQALAATEVAAALCIPHRTAAERMGRAVELVDRLPLTLEALCAGRIDARRASLIAEATRDLPGDLRSAVEKVIVPLAGSRVSGRVKELLDRAVLAADPDAAASRERAARASRTVDHYSAGDGVGVIHARLTAEGASAVFTLLDLLAQHTGGEGGGADGRGIDARRADALTDICTELLDTGHLDLTGTCPTGSTAPGEDQEAAAGDCATSAGGENGSDAASAGEGPDPAAAGGFVDIGVGPDSAPEENSARSANLGIVTNPSTSSGAAAAAGSAVVAGRRAAGSLWRGLARHGRRPHLSVTVALSTLAGLDRLPGHLAGHGAITAELAKNLAAAYGTVTLIAVDPGAGTAAAMSATEYRPRQATADQVIAAAGTCGFPSCRTPAWRCDIDHVVPFAHDDPAAGGPTDIGNCSPECRRHHLLKTHTRWRAENLLDRTMAWVSPTGHSYVDRPREFTLPGETIDPDLVGVFHSATAPPLGGPPPSGCCPPNDPDAEGHPGEPSRWRPPIAGFLVTSNADPIMGCDPSRPGRSAPRGDPCDTGDSCDTGGLGQPGCANDPGDPGGPTDVLLRVRAIRRAQDRSTALSRLRHLRPVINPAGIVAQDSADPALMASRLRSLLARHWTRMDSNDHAEPHETDPHDTGIHHDHRYQADPPALRPTGTDDTPPF